MNIIGERVLGLPREPGFDPEHAVEPDPAELREPRWTHRSTPRSPTSCSSTTRAVRRRLDFDAPGRSRGDPRVHRARAAGAHRRPTRRTWRWVVVTDADKKAALAEIYRGGCLTLPGAAVRSRRRTRRPDACTRARCSWRRPSSDVPVLVIPCIERRLDGAARSSSRRRRSGRSCRRRGASCSPSGRAVSARCGPPRTSGTRPRRREVLGIPDTVTQVAMFPVAHTIGTDFKRGDAAAAGDDHVLGAMGHDAVNGPVSPLLRPRSSDEYAPVPWDAQARTATAGHDRGRGERALATEDRRTTAAVAASRARRRRRRRLLPDPGRGRGTTREAADDAFAATGPVIDVQTHLVDPDALARRRRRRARRLPAHGRSRTVGRPVDPHLLDAAAWARLVFGVERDRDRAAHVDARATPTTTCSLNPQIAAARELVDRYAGTGRVLTHTIVHPNLGPAELDAMVELARRAPAVGLEVLHALRAADDGVADRRLVPRRRRDRLPVPRARPRARAARSSPRTRASAGRSPPRRWRPRRRATSARPRRRSPTSTFVVYHSGYERDPDGEEGAYDPVDADAASTGWSRASPRAGIGAGRQRVRRARQHVVPDAAPAGRGRARARQAAARGRARAHRVGHRLDLVRLAAAAHRRVPRVHDPGAHAGASSATRRSPPRPRRRSSA